MYYNYYYYFVLCNNNNYYYFVYVIIIYYLKLFSLPKLNICCDYRHDLFVSTIYSPLGSAVTIVNGWFTTVRGHSLYVVRDILKIRDV